MLVSVPGLSFLELGYSPDASSIMPGLQRLKPNSAWGAMNIRTPGKGAADVYLSMGAGQFAEGGAGTRAVQRLEWVDGHLSADAYARFTGLAYPSKGELLIPERELLLRVNKGSYYRAEPGLLGDQLEAAGVSLSVWGNAGKGFSGSDRTREETARNDRRYAPLMLMNRSGTVAKGSINETGLIWDGTYPSGLRTDYGWLLDRLHEQPSRSVTLIELGDLQRLYDEKPMYTEEAFRQMKRKILSELDRFIGELTISPGFTAHFPHHEATAIADPGMGQELWLFSPQVNTDAAKAKALLAPLMIYSKHGTEGLLTSETTRRAGIVSFVDVAPTLLQTFGLTVPKEMIGLPIQRKPRAGAWDELMSEVGHMSQVYAARPKLLYGLAVYEIVVMLAALGLGLFAAHRLKSCGRSVLKAALFSLLLAPAGLLCMGLAQEMATWIVYVCTFGGVLAVSAVCGVYAKSPQRVILCLAVIGLIVGALFMEDGFHGAEAMQHSVLGYDVMIGARYYGMGNECMGVLLGAALLGLTALQQSLRQSRRGRLSGLVAAQVSEAAAEWPRVQAAAGFMAMAQEAVQATEAIVPRAEAKAQCGEDGGIGAGGLGALPASARRGGAKAQSGEDGGIGAGGQWALPASARRGGAKAQCDSAAGSRAAALADCAGEPALGAAAAGPGAAAGSLASAAAWREPRWALWRSRWAKRSARARAAAWRAAPAAAAGALVAGYLAAPALGTNAGGALSAAVGFGALGARLAGGRRWLRTAPVLALLLCAALAGLWLLNGGAAMGGAADRQSHIGRAFESLLQGRLDLIGDIISRKVEMNVHLIGVSAWSKVLLTSLAVMAVLVLRPRGRFRRWQRLYPYLMYGIAANVMGTIAALLLNDSGIVAAATMIVYSSVPLLLLKLDGDTISDVR
ncbi:hypothetical protein CF651_10035 [Paenibacillus rigui]|uniref:Uncharacterized protein n=1 Tax=Paenibacillus rigui TaxID=554312 RepID=A0A229UTA8_9BACL|nr:hypothetical protein CF651_10035 [Paenibacillus rigui]